jgi:hypothetical protein
MFGELLAVQVSNTEFRAVAVRVALWLLGIVPALAVNVPVLDPAGTLIELLATGNRELLLESNTSMPPEGAVPLRVAVQVVVVPDCKLVGVQVTSETVRVCGKAMFAKTRIKTALEVQPRTIRLRWCLI